MRKIALVAFTAFTLLACTNNAKTEKTEVATDEHAGHDHATAEDHAGAAVDHGVAAAEAAASKAKADLDAAAKSGDKKAQEEALKRKQLLKKLVRK